MQLYYSQTSPFARKVTMLLHYTGLIDQCELVLTTFTSEELRQKNPLGKIPALVKDDLVLTESDLINEYLDDFWALEGNLSLLNRGSRFYYLERKAAAQANGVLEAAVQSMFESKRETEQSGHWLARWKEAMQKGLTELDVKYCGKIKKINMTSFTVAATLGYLDFRHPQLNWREWNSELANWFDEISQQAWFIQTKPPC
ncbi:glutathione S-transferase N-terminal domain-containing protein [Agaribacterium sp. ZY112]|uniref:glutathione S-transferase N-terminal domain-containing protein n=1 Tax=Agaribacterium sp. ZY112 TaxID=3233574 RepID=UPI003525796B